MRKNQAHPTNKFLKIGIFLPIFHQITPETLIEKEVENQLRRGFASAKLDAKNILKDSNAQTNIAIGMLVSFCAVIGIGAIREYQEINSNEPQTGNKIKHIGKAINRSLKKHWKKGAILSSLTATTVFVVQLINRQSKRP